MSEQETPPVRRPVANWILAGLIAAVGVTIFVFTVRSGRADSALLFVGLPVLLAVALAVTPGRTAHGRVFRFTTILLLLAAVALHEGAICVVLAAPLVYLVAHGTAEVVSWRHKSPRAYTLLPLPLLLVAAMEGTGDTLRIHPYQSVEVVRVVALPADVVLSRLTAGPRPTPVRSLPLRTLRVPTPHHVTGTGLTVGDHWLFGYHGTAHGPGGHLVAEVTARDPQRVSFGFREDTSLTARWFTWRQADLRWHAVDPGHTEVRITVSYERGLDPSWYFGPLQDILLHQGVGHLLDMLTLT